VSGDLSDNYRNTAQDTPPMPTPIRSILVVERVGVGIFLCRANNIL
jgi:hypothetical protein